MDDVARLLRRVLLGGAALTLVVGCASSERPTGTGARTSVTPVPRLTPSVAPPAATAPRAATTTAPRGPRFVLNTHCGIGHAKFDGVWWKANPRRPDGTMQPLSDGSHNPPPGWDNPSQVGTMRRLGPDVAEFRDTAGHVVRFDRQRVGPSEFPCD